MVNDYGKRPKIPEVVELEAMEGATGVEVGTDARVLRDMLPRGVARQRRAGGGHPPQDSRRVGD